MGVFKDEASFDALKLALAAASGMLSRMRTRYPSPGQMPVVFLAPPTYYDLMNPTTTNPFTILNSTKTLRPSYATIPLYAIVPFTTTQAQTPPPHSLDSTFWDVVERTVHGAVALAWFLSVIAEAVSQKDLGLVRHDREPSSCDPFDSDPLPFIPIEDDLLRVDVSGLESISPSELYLEEEGSMTAVPTLFPRKTQRHSRRRSSSSDMTLVTPLEGYLPSEDLSFLLQTPDNELYFNPKSLGAITPPWPFNSSVITTSPLSLA